MPNLVNPYRFAIATGGEDAYDYDGTNDWLSHTTSTGYPASFTKVTVSVWVERDGTGTNDVILRTANTAGPKMRFSVNIGTSNDLSVAGRNTSGTTTLQINAGTMSSTSQWYHILFSLDLSDTAKRHIYIDDSSETWSVTTYDTSSNIDGVVDTYGIGYAPDSAGLAFDGSISELWVDYGTYMDLSVEANRRKFITAGGLPADLGATGQLPTGSTPDEYLKNGRDQLGARASYSVTGSPVAVDGPNP